MRAHRCMQLNLIIPPTVLRKEYEKLFRYRAVPATQKFGLSLFVKSVQRHILKLPTREGSILL